jgi:hypothetical protein
MAGTTSKSFMSLHSPANKENGGVGSVRLESSFPRKRESRLLPLFFTWIPAFAGMTDTLLTKTFSKEITKDTKGWRSCTLKLRAPRGLRGAHLLWGRLPRLHPKGAALKLAILCLFLLLSATAVRAQVSREYQLKAVFLWRLAQFTEWPQDTFEASTDPIVICVAGDNPFGDALETAVRGEKAHGRPLAVQYFRGVDPIKACHIVYLGPPVARQGKELGAALAGKSILTVMDTEISSRNFSPMIRFLTENNKVKLLVNLKAVVSARLVLDPRLLRAAEIVES